MRFYRDYSIADFSFCIFFTALATYGSFYTAARAGVCEELSHHAELMRSVVEMGLNLENCEQWLERAVLAILAVTIIVMVVRVCRSLSTFISLLFIFYFNLTASPTPRCFKLLFSSRKVLQRAVDRLAQHAPLAFAF